MRTIIAAVLSLLPVCAMAQTTEPFGLYVNGLTAATSIGQSDQLYVRQGAVSKQVTGSTLYSPSVPVTITNSTASDYALSLNVSGSTTGGLSIGQSATGTPLGGNGLNIINIVSDNRPVGSNVLGSGILVQHIFGGAAMTGNRAAIDAAALLTATSGNSSIQGAYVGGSFLGQASVNDNGTGVTLSTAKGIVGGINPVGSCAAGATNFFACQGAEVDIQMATGSSAFAKEGFLIAKLAGDRVQGSVVDCGLCFIDQSGGTVGWSQGIQFGPPSVFSTAQWPFTSSSTAIGVANPGALGTAIDFTGVTGSNFFLKSTNYTVDWSGNSIGATFRATAAAPTVSSGQIGYGATTTSSGTCPTGTVGGQTVQGCIIVNIAGTSRNVPFF